MEGGASDDVLWVWGMLQVYLNLGWRLLPYGSYKLTEDHSLERKLAVRKFGFVYHTLNASPLFQFVEGILISLFGELSH